MRIEDKYPLVNKHVIIELRFILMTEKGEQARLYF